MVLPPLQIEGLAAGLLRWDVMLGASALAAIYFGFAQRRDLANAMGLDHADIMLLTVGSLAGQALNLPLAIVDDAVLAVNLGGVLVPAIVVARFARRGTLRLTGVVVGTAIVAATTLFIVDIREGAGVVAPFPQFLLPPLVAFVVGLISARGRPTAAGPYAFTTGSFGTLIGADLLLLPRLGELAGTSPPGTALVIGGAGAFDLVFLGGALALVLALGVAAVATQEPTTPVLAHARAVRVPDPRAALARADQLGALSPRERCVVHLARANEALADRDGRGAVMAAHRAVDTLLRSGAPPLLEHVRAGHVDAGLREELKRLAVLARDAEAVAPSWAAAADAVELAKHAAGGLWRDARGSMRIEGAGP